MSDPLEKGEVQLDVVTDNQIAYAVRQDEPQQTYIREDVVRAQIEAAVKRALEDAANHVDCGGCIGRCYDFYNCKQIQAESIRAIDPAQFVEGDKQ